MTGIQQLDLLDATHSLVIQGTTAASICRRSICRSPLGLGNGMQERNGGMGMRARQTLSRRFFALLCACCATVVLGGVACTGGSAPGSALQITLHPVTDAGPAYLSVTGLSSAELSRLRTSSLDDTGWQGVLKVTAGDLTGGQAANDVPAVLGKYVVTDDSLTFTPLFPFDPGRTYRAAFDPATIAREAGLVTSVVSLPPIATTPTTVVTAVFPAAEVVPENLLRMYIQFSAPMGSGRAHDFVRLLDVTGGKEEVVEGAFLPIEADFWSPDHTRYTIILDPGRVKRGILPNRQRGRPLVAGHEYVLDIAAAWPDENRQPLKSGMRHMFRAGPVLEEAIKLSDWRIAAPRAGTRDPLVVTFAKPLDHAVVARALSVEPKGQAAINGTVSVEAGDTRWMFVPETAWRAAEYDLVAGAYLEDTQGNQIGRPFELAIDTVKDETRPDAFRVAFSITGG